MPHTSAMPEKVLSAQPSSAALGGKEKEILELILESWPTCALEIAQHFNEDLSSRDSKKLASTKYSYYLKKLVDKQLVLSKRMGNALVVWPLQAEKLRTIHKILEFRHEPAHLPAQEAKNQKAPQFASSPGASASGSAGRK
ncbi:MAG: hypothetical protein NTW59_05150 [Candidatus Diapherotrites archaeon]|nr:hypothetical protein [Candidatus Diapherotrites archaeon]